MIPGAFLVWHQKRLPNDQRVTVDVKGFLTGLPALFFGRKSGVKGVHCPSILAQRANRAFPIDPGPAVQRAGDQLLDQQTYGKPLKTLGFGA